jgi:alpha-mannosidase
MQYTQLVILIPCHSLEDFPLHHEGDDAQGLLAHWTAMWHPALLDAARAMPKWARVDDPPQELAGRLLLVPSVSAGNLPAGFAARAEDEGAIVIRSAGDRAAIIAEALGHLANPPAIDAELVADFLALGYCYLQVQLLTRQMRYASNLDEIYFNKQLIAAAGAAAAGDNAQASELLQSCFDVLGQERDHFYPVDAYLMDLTLVAETTLEPLRSTLANDELPINLLISGSTLAALADSDPATLALLRDAVAAERVTLIGGECDEGPAALYDYETLLAELRRGLAAYESHLGLRPHVFGRRRFGLSPMQPQVLKRLDFTGAVHATFDGGRFPDGSQTKSTWEGIDGSEIDALARPPLDASKPETFLGFCSKMGQSMDSDHVATLYFAHWPGQACSWYDDLRRIARRGPVLGRFVSLARYFADTSHSGLRDRFQADLYRSPYLKQAVQRSEENPLSTIRDAYTQAARAHAAGALSTLASLLSGRERSADMSKMSAVVEATSAFAAALPRSGAKTQPGYLVANPHSFVRRVLVEVPKLSALPRVERPIYAAGNAGGVKRVVVDVPPLGFVWVTGEKSGGSSEKPLVATDEDGISLRNEHMEIRFDPTTGSLRSLHDYNSRRNRLSQQLALRRPARRGDDEDDRGYSVMVGEGVETTLSDAAVGEVQTRGQLVDREGQLLARFTQRYRLIRGSRVLRIDIDLDPQTLPQGDAWDSYYACRFAWADETAEFLRTVGGTRAATTISKLEAPLYVELDLPNQRLAFLTGGLPYHRRTGARMLDAILISPGETARSFTLGVGVDVTHPLQEALGLLTPATVEYQLAGPPSSAASGWLFHIDSKNVIATSWSPLVENDRIAGVRVRLLEAYGREATVAISTFRAAASAQKVDFLGNRLAECEIEKDKVRCSLTGGEWAEVEIRFA